MCKETDRERKAGKDLANKLIDHIKCMGVESCKIPAKEGYIVKVYREHITTGDPCWCSPRVIKVRAGKTKQKNKPI